ncbi:MAG: hypothetical protein ACYDDT_03755 [Sulfuricella sp.]
MTDVGFGESFPSTNFRASLTGSFVHDPAFHHRKLTATKLPVVNDSNGSIGVIGSKVKNNREIRFLYRVNFQPKIQNQSHEGYSNNASSSVRPDGTLADTATDLGPVLVSGFFEKGYNV